tara:strand:- start:494 stop:910 length:417 start_codon:yes stop_codon:yes gene_type:complete
MVSDAPAPQPIRMTIPSEPPNKTGSPSSQDNENGNTSWFQRYNPNVGWIGLSALVFIGVAFWAIVTVGVDPIFFFGMLFLFLIFVVVIRMIWLLKRNPLAAPRDLIRNGFSSLLLVLAGIATPIMLITLIVTVWLLTL